MQLSRLAEFRESCFGLVSCSLLLTVPGLKGVGMNVIGGFVLVNAALQSMALLELGGDSSAPSIPDYFCCAVTCRIDHSKTNMESTEHPGCLITNRKRLETLDRKTRFKVQTMSSGSSSSEQRAEIVCGKPMAECPMKAKCDEVESLNGKRCPAQVPRFFKQED